MRTSGCVNFKKRLSVSYKPAGYTSVAPYLTVNGAKRTIEFLIRVFAAEPLRMIHGSSANGVASWMKVERPGGLAHRLHRVERSSAIERISYPAKPSSF